VGDVKVAGRMPVDLFFVRHGESEGNAAREAHKRGDNSLLTDEFNARPSSQWRLTDLGEQQAEAAGAWLRRWMDDQGMAAFDRYYCSPYVRTMQTAAGLRLPGAAWQLEPLLRERDYGLWPVDKQAAAREFPRSLEMKQRDRFLWRPDGGESTPDLELRAREMFGTFARELSGRRVICVTHEDFMLAVRFRLEKLTIARWLALDDQPEEKIVNCGILHYTRKDPGSDEVLDRFGWVHRIEPSGPEPALSPIERPRFTDDELLDLAKAGW
jgi:broad specificity phosphatase PhoE